MNLRICSPRTVRGALCAGILLLCSTFSSAHNPDANSVDATAAAQWKAGAPQVQLEGQIEIVHQDFKDGHGKFVYTLKQADGARLPLQFVKHPPTHVLTGDHVQVNGQMSGGSLILYSGGNVKQSGGGSSSCTADSGSSCSTTASSIPVPNTFGNQSVLVILVNFQDDAVQPYTAADAQNLYFGTGSTLSNFISENSYGQTSITGTVVGWYTIPVSVTTCDTSQIATDAQNAATAAGVNLSNYTRYVYAFPYDGACGGWAGASTVGGNPSESWINWNSPGIQLIDHELGHAFGLWHSHSLNCGTTTICSSGTIVEYGDNIDTMGYSQGPSPEYNAVQKERLGWLNYGASPSIQTVTGSGTYTIYPYELAGPGPNALKILQSTNPTTGAKTWYYLEARQAIGFDAFLTNGICSACYTQNETTGVLFHLGTDGDTNSSLALAMTPANPLPGWYDDSLAVGQSFQDSTAGVTFTPTAVSSSGASIQITINNGPVCSAANPGVSISPAQSQSVTSGTAVNFTVTVTDNDSSSCAPATFNLSGTVPAGWAGVFTTGALSLSPGKSGSATLGVTSPVGTADGSYNVAVSATNASASSYSGSAAATYVINTAPLSIGVSANPSATLPGQTVMVTVSATSGTSPAAGVSVSATITAPNGRSQTVTGTTGSNGIASFAYNLSKHAAAGTYPVQANLGSSTTKNAAATVGASTTFTVQ
jgi:M6 family metalloprotease-like protein